MEIKYEQPDCEIIQRTIDLAERLADEYRQVSNYSKASSWCIRATQWAEKVGDEKHQKEIYEKAINFYLKYAETMEEKGSLSSASIGYAQAAKWTDRIGDIAGRDKLYEKAALTLQEAAGTYEKLAPFLLNQDTCEASSALRDYFLNDNERFTYFKKITLIVEDCRNFFVEIEGRYYERTFS